MEYLEYSHGIFSWEKAAGLDEGSGGADPRAGSCNYNSFGCERNLALKACRFSAAVYRDGACFYSMRGGYRLN